MPIGGERIALDRSIRSLQCQSHTSWELLAVDYASPGGKNACLQSWTGQDPRIRLGILNGNRCPAAARNAALRAARGKFIAYLDPSDEYYPDYLAEVVKAGQESDVLLFAFDIDYENGSAGGRPTAWEPGRAVQRLFAQNIVPPMGVAHRRSALERVGGFNELLWRGEEWDFWKRLARAGLRFRFLPKKAGRYRGEAESVNLRRAATPWQLERLNANWLAGRPLFSPACETRAGAVAQVGNLPETSLPGHIGNPHHVGVRKVESIMFVSPHCLVDDTNGAAISTCETLQFLASLGFRCRAFCGPRLDDAGRSFAEETAAPIDACKALGDRLAAPSRTRMVSASAGKLPVTICDTALPRFSSAGGPQAEAFLAACEMFLKKNRPGAVMSYGGDPLSLATMALAKRLDIPVVFCLRNFKLKVSMP